ncbi:MAG: Arsenical pump membrane protein [Deltaproteobacteria bacterium ADurb.Bin510]|nr:MAG: Arsenical pump membrane protein [Deltaproteobacteria bacterium ADurb.Bin510]
MVRSKFKVFLVGLLLCCGWQTAGAAEAAGDVLQLSGRVATVQGKGLPEALIEVMVGGVKQEVEIESSSDGSFSARLQVPAGSLAEGQAEVLVTKSGFKKLEGAKVVPVRAGPEGNYLANVELELERVKNPAFYIATFILILVYVIIAFEWLHRTLAAMVCAAAVLVISYTFGTFNPDYFILSFEGAMKAIDMNVIFLLMAMMIIVGVLKKTGVFQWLAYKSYEAARGNIYVLATILMVVTALASAFLDNVTTMLLMIPVTIEIALALKINPIAFLMPEVFASNVGGTATLIGDPPNIMIGSYANLSFMDFATNLSLVCLLCLVVTIGYFLMFYRKEFRKAHLSLEEVKTLTAKLREEYQITDRKLLIQSGTVLIITIALFICHGFLHMEPSVAALIGAAVLLVISRQDIVHMLEHEVEWPTLIFFMMLFIVVAGAEETGLIQIIADWVNDASQGSVITAALIVLWVSAIASAIVDNIPFTATVMPIVAFLTTSIPGAETGVLWWALALGACLGGNGSMIGASANVVTVGMADRAGYHISFMQYLKVAFVPMLLTIFISMAWILIVMI